MKVVLFDADGVLTLPEEFFSQIYARSHGLDNELFERFFKGVFQAAIIGQADLKKLISQNADIWQYGDPDSILKQWFDSEDVRNEEALNVIQQLRANGTKCYLATNQEKYRGAYFKEVMFKGMFDDYFISNEMGVAKPNNEFFKIILSKICQEAPGLKEENVIFYDDTESHVSSAKALGIDARLYTGIDQIKSLL